MTGEKEVHGTISSLPGAIVIAGLTGNLRCPIGVGHDGEKGSAWYHTVIAGLTGNLSTGNLERERCPIGVGHDNETVGHDKEEERA